SNYGGILEWTQLDSNVIQSRRSRRHRTFDRDASYDGTGNHQPQQDVLDVGVGYGDRREGQRPRVVQCLCSTANCRFAYRGLDHIRAGNNIAQLKIAGGWIVALGAAE